ncbi:hypothetical protein FB45DRAFT_1038433 [Roridomyces roridus]|uniref:Uncharacterized protein n=1 Tax=Roridomyces roridus TaxID=1738132 RepID=A0AAD7B457_9AGAR|nr:hypothetical protein FB45DRAFT_1038433 [Roridomyces roridus]
MLWGASSVGYLPFLLTLQDAIWGEFSPFELSKENAIRVSIDIGDTLEAVLTDQDASGLLDEDLSGTGEPLPSEDSATAPDFLDLPLPLPDPVSPSPTKRPAHHAFDPPSVDPTSSKCLEPPSHLVSTLGVSQPSKKHHWEAPIHSHGSNGSLPSMNSPPLGHPQPSHGSSQPLP